MNRINLLLSRLTLLAILVHPNDLTFVTANTNTNASNDNLNASDNKGHLQRGRGGGRGIPESIIVRRDTSLPSPRIVGGSYASAGTYPWFVMLYYRNKYNYYQEEYYRQKCGGTLIEPNIVLTAAHCIDSDMRDVGAAAYIGAFDINSPTNGGQEAEFITVERIDVHPTYSFRTVDNDFALLRLSRPSNIQPVKWDTMGLSDSYLTGKD